MDWKYKHFNHEAVYNASRTSVLEAARTVVADSLVVVENTPDGFVARGHSGWHPAIATFHVTQAAEGTALAVELLVERSAARSYMLVDIGGFYNALIDKWFTGIEQHLAGGSEQILVSKTTSGTMLTRGCLAGCLVYLVVGTCLVLLAFPLDRLLFSQTAAPFQGPVSILAAFIGLLAGVGVFVYVVFPDAPLAIFIRERLQRNQNKDKQ